MFFDRTSGEFYLGTADGFAISSPEALLAEHTEKPLILTAIYINNQLYQPNISQTDLSHSDTGRSGTSSLPEQSIRYSQRIELAYDQNNLAFELSDLSYSLEEKANLYIVWKVWIVSGTC